MLNRRHFIGLVPASAFAIATNRAISQEPTTSQEEAKGVLAGPPVVQHPGPNSFTVSVALEALATAWIEWGFAKDKLEHIAKPTQYGLVKANDRGLAIRVRSESPFPTGQPIFYRVVAQRLRYKNAYSLHRSEPEYSEIQKLKLPSPNAKKLVVAIVNDTHENQETLTRLHKRLNDIEPDLLVWNGDTCNDFDLEDNPAKVVLAPLGRQASGWASRWPLVFVPGNHDVRGRRAQELPEYLPGWPDQESLPYSKALRLGPLAMITLDTGEDKPDAHWVFAGTAAYEPYRKEQATWLKKSLAKPEIASAPFLIASCHIPLIGLKGERDGTRLDHNRGGSTCGTAAPYWLPHLSKANCKMVVSGHQHWGRVLNPTDKQPITQVIGGAPQPKYATLTLLEVTPERLTMRMEDLNGKLLHKREFQAT